MPTCPTCGTELFKAGDLCARCAVPPPGLFSRRQARCHRLSRAWAIGFGILFPLVSLALLTGWTPWEQQRADGFPIPVVLLRGRQIGLAVIQYAVHYGTFPPAYVADENGRPLHSWRVLILPFLGEDDLYRQYRFDEPWNGPRNSRLLKQIPECYRHPDSTAAAGVTSFLAPVGQHTILSPNVAVGFADIPDGVTSTILLGEAESAGVLWLEPRDIDADRPHVPVNQPDGFQGRYPDAFLAMFADGHGAWIRSDIGPTLRGLLTRDGGEEIDPDSY